MFLHVHGIMSEAEERCRLEGAEAGRLELMLTYVKVEECVASRIADEFRDFVAPTVVLINPMPFESLDVVVDLSLTFHW